MLINVMLIKKKHVFGYNFLLFGYLDRKWSIITLKICLSPYVWLFFVKKLSKAEALKLHLVKERIILYHKRYKNKISSQTPLTPKVSDGIEFAVNLPLGCTLQMLIDQQSMSDKGKCISNVHVINRTRQQNLDVLNGNHVASHFSTIGQLVYTLHRSVHKFM